MKNIPEKVKKRKSETKEYQNMIILTTENGSNLIIEQIDDENEIGFYHDRDDSYSWVSLEQAKNLVEFLNKQISKIETKENENI